LRPTPWHRSTSGLGRSLGLNRLPL